MNIPTFDELSENPCARMPVCLCLDVSGSSAKELNRGVDMFYDALRNDVIASYSAEVCIVMFGGDGVVCALDFAEIHQCPKPPVLNAAEPGERPLGEAVNMALGLLRRRIQEYKNKGVDYYTPRLVIMSDGASGGSPAELNGAVAETTELAAQNKLRVFPIGVGEHADMEALSRLSPKRQPVRLDEMGYTEYFRWLGFSFTEEFTSTPGEKTDLDIDYDPERLKDAQTFDF